MKTKISNKYKKNWKKKNIKHKTKENISNKQNDDVDDDE